MKKFQLSTFKGRAKFQILSRQSSVFPSSSVYSVYSVVKNSSSSLGALGDLAVQPITAAINALVIIVSLRLFKDFGVA